MNKQPPDGEGNTWLDAIESMPQIVWAGDPSGNIDYYNKRWQEYTGLTLEESKNWGWRPAVHPDDFERTVECWREALEAGKLFEIEVRLRRFDGTYRWHVSRAQAIRNRAGEITRWVGTCADIDDYRAAQAEIRALNEGLEERVRERTRQLARANEDLLLAQKGSALLAAIVASSDDAIISETLEGAITSWNAGAERLFGYSAGEAIGRDISLIHPPEGMEDEAALLQRLRESEEVQRLERTRRRKDGETVQVALTLSPIRDAQGRVIGGSKIFRDIGERLRAQEELRRGRAVLQFLLESLPVLFVVLTPDFKIVWVSDAYLEASMTKRAEITGQDIFDVFPDNPLDTGTKGASKLRASFERVLKTGGSDVMAIQKYDIRRRDGTFEERYWSPTNSAVLGADGGVEFIIHRAEDVTEFVKRSLQPPAQLSGRMEQMEAEMFFNSQQLRAANLKLHEANRQLEEAKVQAEAGNRAKSRFLSNISHEIRTPLNAILGYAQLLLRDQTLGTEAKRNLEIIGRSGEHLLNLINEVLDMSKIEAGRAEIRPVAFDLAKLFGDLAAMFRLQAEAKALQFEMTFSGEKAPYVAADEGKIRQTLINLVGNAVKFTKLGYVGLHVHLRENGAESLWLSATVEDSGDGMTAEEQANLFEPFHQAKGKLNTVEGTGLGLAISRQYARLMGGDISVMSSPGSGSKFKFEVPVARADGRVAARDSDPRRVKGIRAGDKIPSILVVDDHAENRAWLMKLLSSVGFAVTGADDGEMAIRRWREGKPDLILMDMHMPGMDGLEATRQIKADGGKETPIVTLTASALEEDRRTAAESGADDFLAKPCREKELLEKMRALLKIDYDYEEEAELSDRPAASAMAQLPPWLAEELRQATLCGNKKRLDQAIFKMRESEAAAFANTLQELADRYEYDALTRLLALKA